MQTIAQIRTYPNKAPVEAFQAKIVAVYEHRKMPSKFGPGDTSAQNIELADIAGNKIRATVWEHPDLAEHKDKEYVFHAGRNGKGIEVRHGSYKNKTTGAEVKTVELSISKAGQLQFVEVYRSQNPNAGVPEAASAPVVASPGAGSPQAHKSTPVPIHGAKVGMAINCATQFMVAADVEYSRVGLKRIAQEIIEVSNELENPVEAVVEAKPVADMTHQEKVEANLAPATENKAKQEKPDEDVPF